MPRNLGARERAKDPRDIQLGSVQAPVSIPSAFNPHIAWLQRNYQGETPFCGEHAGTHFKAILDNNFLSGNPVERKNPRYGTIKLKTPSSPVYDGFPIADGTTLTAIFKWLQKVGADDYEPLENNILLPLETYSDPSVVTPDMDANAMASTINSYAFCNTDFESLCQAVYQNKAVLILIKCDDGFWGTSTPTFTTPTDGHFICMYGYDENYIYIVDSADPNDNFAFKAIAKQYVTPEFFFEAGTAIVLTPAVKQAITSNTPVPASVTQALTSGQVSLAEQILNDIEAALTLIKKEI